MFRFVCFFSLVIAGQYAAAASPDYLDNHSCKECHEAIYNEFEHSAHARSYFTDTLHRTIAQKAEPDRYECAPCHMPAAGSLEELVRGTREPDSRDRRQKDGVSCFFCHTIAYVKKAHAHNINLPARQAKGYKPSLFGSLDNPDENDKHSSLKSPIYDDMACKGCHSHKINENNVTVFRAMKEGESSRECIRCHMPKVPGGVEKMNKRSRREHYSHRFPGIENEAFRKTGYGLSVHRTDKGIAVTLTNKMPHPMIIQPARAKYLAIEVLRNGKMIWRNYQKSPEEDSQAYFAMHFFRDGKPVALPIHATSRRVNNLAGKESRTLNYKIPELKAGDRVRVSLYVRPAKRECIRAVGALPEEFTTPMLIRRLEWTVP